jgi:hypothetical protein
MTTLAYSVIPRTPDCFSSVNPHFAKTGAPARMADGRIMTDYRPRCFQYPLAASQAWGGNDARLRMVHGADELMEAARQMNNRKVLPTSCEDTMVPELYKRVCSWDGCKVLPGNFQGIGTGRIYVNSASGSASNPQALSDVSVPPIPNTFPRQPPSVGSQCAADDNETAWEVKGNVSLTGGSAKSHPYSAPRS